MTEKVFISADDSYLFGQGTHYDIYKKLGAHLSTEEGVDGTFFGVWAPNAVQVHVIGSFNDWNETIIGNASTTFSNMPTTADTARPINTTAISQGILFLKLSKRKSTIKQP